MERPVGQPGEAAGLLGLRHWQRRRPRRPTRGASFVPANVFCINGKFDPDPHLSLFPQVVVALLFFACRPVLSTDS